MGEEGGREGSEARGRQRRRREAMRGEGGFETEIRKKADSNALYERMRIFFWVRSYATRERGLRVMDGDIANEPDFT